MAGALGVTLGLSGRASAAAAARGALLTETSVPVGQPIPLDGRGMAAASMSGHLTVNRPTPVSTYVRPKFNIREPSEGGFLVPFA